MRRPSQAGAQKYLYGNILGNDLVGQFGLQEFAVEACDVGNGFVLRANGLARTCVGAVSESQFVHLRNHGLDALGSLGASLRQ